MSQIKEQDKTLDEMDTSNLPEAGFKTLVIEMLNELSGRIDYLSENVKKEIGGVLVP